MNNGTRLGHFFCCPRGSVYVAKRAVTLGGTRLRTMQQFIFDVGAEGVNLREKFRRGLMVGNFQPTDQFEYSDPNDAPDTRTSPEGMPEALSGLAVNSFVLSGGIQIARAIARSVVHAGSCTRNGSDPCDFARAGSSWQNEAPF